MSTPATPVLPDYGGACLDGIMPALTGSVGRPDWAPEVLDGARAVVLLVLDGLGWCQLEDRRAWLPNLASLEGRAITSVAPSTTATALTSIATGLTPGEHGIVGYRMMVGGSILNSLRWFGPTGDRRFDAPPAEIQPHPPFLGARLPIVTPTELIGSAFSEAHLRGGEPVGWRASSSIPVLVRQLVDAGRPLVYAYYAGVDKIAHERGLGEFYDAELRDADRLVGDLLDILDADTALVVTADHGQVEVGDRIIEPSRELLGFTSGQSGEGRMRWFHARRGADSDLLDAVTDELGSTGWVRTIDEVIAEGWFGRRVPPPVRSRLGDVVVAAREPVSYHDPDDSGPFELICRHGSLTPDEMLVPLVAARGRA